jgi:tRNA threonylcarbamoyladenosine biosynthesis protein TsaB
MKILAIEASTHLASVALSIEGALLHKDCPPDVNSSLTLLPTLQALLAEAGVGLAQCDAIAFGAGPGAFTGLRVAVGVTQGLAFAHDLPVLPIETLAAVAWAGGAQRTLAALDARMNEIYAACYLRQDGDGGVLRQGDITVCGPTLVPLGNAADEPDGWTVCGNAASVYPAFAERLATAGLRALPAALPHASAVAQLGAIDCLAGRAVAAELALPLYVRDKVAFTVAERLAAGGRA